VLLDSIVPSFSSTDYLHWISVCMYSK